MKRNNYSESGVVNNTFVKKYDNHISNEIIKEEFEKSKKIHQLAQKTTLFSFPKTISHKNRTITLEYIDNAQELRQIIFANNNFFAQNKKQLKKLFKQLGSSLTHIHKNLKTTKQEVSDPIKKGKKVCLYSDFGLTNILIKGKDIYLIDPSFNSTNDYVYAYGSFYFDLAYFIFSLRHLHPLKHKFLLRNTKYLEDAFLSGYGKIDKKVLEQYVEHTKQLYIAHLPNTLRGFIWKCLI